MKSVSISNRSRKLNDLLKQAVEGGLILRSADGREFILAEIDDFNREIELTRQNKKLMRFLDQRASCKKTVPLAQVKAQLGIK